MAKFLFLSLFFLVGCGPGDTENSLFGSKTNIDSEFVPYVNRFVEYTRENGLNVSTKGLILERKVLDRQTLGVCYLGQKTVYINSLYWGRHMTVYPYSKEQLIFHELAHCLLKRGHKENSMPSSVGDIPSSIMYPTFFSSHFYLANYSYYVLELFNPNIDPLTHAATAGNDGFDWNHYTTKIHHKFNEDTEEFDISHFSCGNH